MLPILLKPQETEIKILYHIEFIDLNLLFFQVANRIWKPFYFGSNLPEEFIFFRGEFRYTFNDDGQTLLTELSGRL